MLIPASEVERYDEQRRQALMCDPGCYVVAPVVGAQPVGRYHSLLFLSWAVFSPEDADVQPVDGVPREVVHSFQSRRTAEDLCRLLNQVR